MLVDKTTLNDLSIFHQEEEQSIFHFLNHTQTNEGREQLRVLLAKPLNSLEAINNMQQALLHLQEVLAHWPTTITNGTIMVLDRFFDTQINSYPAQPNTINSLVYKMLNAPDYSITKYTVTHFISFVQGMQQVADLLANSKSPLLQFAVEQILLLLKKPFTAQALQHDKQQPLSHTAILQYAGFIRHQYKQELYELINVYSKLDAYLSLAIASKQNNFSFPSFKTSKEPTLHAVGLYHPLLQTPVSYEVNLEHGSNFLFLTGANMAGKSTFIKAVGISVYLAHLGMSVPASGMELSLFDGLLSNIHVVDNVIKGESYFFNEVQRIKGTIEKISDGKNWLILIDELFKGTNVQDAMKCSTTVIEGLHKMPKALFVLSTHLYEIGDALRQYSNIQFKYFETSIANEQLVFSYQLKDGISNDRLGYLILKKEGVVKLLEDL
jgi:DNA mismatch repair ATPase MutS